MCNNNVYNIIIDVSGDSNANTSTSIVDSALCLTPILLVVYSSLEGLVPRQPYKPKVPQLEKLEHCNWES